MYWGCVCGKCPTLDDILGTCLGEILQQADIKYPKQSLFAS